MVRQCRVEWGMLIEFAVLGVCGGGRLVVLLEAKDWKRESSYRTRGRHQTYRFVSSLGCPSCQSKPLITPENLEELLNLIIRKIALVVLEKCLRARVQDGSS